MNRLVVPNEAGGFVAEELRNRLQQGHMVRIAFGGNSMWPTLDGRSDTVELVPLSMEEPLEKGEIYLFRYCGHCVVHRFVRKEGTLCVMRGDHNVGVEQVPRADVWARLVAVVHGDGSREECHTKRWKRRSRRVLVWRDVRCWMAKHFGRRERRWQRWIYLVGLLLLMWMPMGALGIPLDNFVLGIRLDHLIHASVYVPCAFFFCDLRLGRRTLSLKKQRIRLLVACIMLALTTETVQYLLPYRGFDINDLVANFLGVTLGWVLTRRIVKGNIQD